MRRLCCDPVCTRVVDREACVVRFYALKWPSIFTTERSLIGLLRVVEWHNGFGFLGFSILSVLLLDRLHKLVQLTNLLVYRLSVWCD